jgi:hypothetical protein
MLRGVTILDLQLEELLEALLFNPLLNAWLRVCKAV